MFTVNHNKCSMWRSLWNLLEKMYIYGQTILFKDAIEKYRKLCLADIVGGTL